MPTEAQEGLTTQVFEIYIRSSAERIWEAITDPEWNAKYGYRAPMKFDLRPGGRFSAHPSAEMQAMGLPETMIDGEIIECVPYRRLVQTYRWLFTPQNQAEGYTRVTWEIEPSNSGFTRLTVIHDELQNAPMMAAAIKSKYDEQGGGGWTLILSDLKSLLETGKTMAE